MLVGIRIVIIIEKYKGWFTSDMQTLPVQNRQNQHDIKYKSLKENSTCNIREGLKDNE